MRRVLLAALAMAGCVAAVPKTQPSFGGAQDRPDLVATPSTRPSLVVLIVVDQMRTDYLDRGLPHFSGGLRKLATEGTWFRDAAYPYLNTVTCPGHSTIGTGALPYRHGMVLNAWWDRRLERSMPCTSDSTERNISYDGVATGGGDSARSLLVPTFAEKLRERTGGRTVGISLKPRAAIPATGKRATAVVWFDERGGWTTSTAFTSKKLPWLDEYFAANPVTKDAGKTWERSLSLAAYEGADDAVGERFPQGWTRTFPHVLAAPGPLYTAQWQRSPFADEYVGGLAGAAVDALGLGRGRGIDFLAVSFSPLDLVGHQFGPASHEVQDLVVRLDRTIGALLQHLDTTLGRDRYVVALSADHGVGPLPEQVADSGRQSGQQALAAVNDALAPFFGVAKHAVHSAYTDLYLAPGVLEKLRKHRQASDAVLQALRTLPAVAHAFYGYDVAAPANRTHADPVRRAAALSYHPARSGDIIIVPKPGWMLSTTAAATHGTLYAHDQRVPVIFFGAGIPASIRETAATPADIAPTLGAIVGVRFAAPDGKPLLPPARSK